MFPSAPSDTRRLCLSRSLALFLDPTHWEAKKRALKTRKMTGNARKHANKHLSLASLRACVLACAPHPGTPGMGSFSRPRLFSRVRVFPRDKNRDRYVAVSILPGLERESENRRRLESYYRQRMNHCKTNHKNDPPRTRDQTRLSTLCVCACVDACLPVCI